MSVEVVRQDGVNEVPDLDRRVFQTETEVWAAAGLVRVKQVYLGTGGTMLVFDQPLTVRDGGGLRRHLGTIWGLSSEEAEAIEWRSGWFDDRERWLLLIPDLS